METKKQQNQKVKQIIATVQRGRSKTLPAIGVLLSTRDLCDVIFPGLDII